MKFSFTFQTLIMVVLAPLLAVITAFWGVYVYRSVYDAILAGFDRKLLTLSSGAAAFVDGDAHARYQQQRSLVALAPLPGGGLLGVAAALDELVAFDSTGVGARSVARIPGERYRTLAADPLAHTWLGVSPDRTSLVVLEVHGMLVRQLAQHALAAPTPAATPEENRKRDWWPGLARFTLPPVGAKRPGAGTSLAFIEPKPPLRAHGGFTLGFSDVEDPFYRRNRSAFATLQKESDLSYLYTQVYRGDKKIFYVLDGTVGAGYSRPGAGDELPNTSVEGAEWVQFLGRSWLSPIQKWEAWGLLKSCFTPVYDSAEKVIAMAGADVNITVIRLRTRWALFSVVLVGVLTLVAAGFISLAVARALTRPLRQIKNSALWIAAGYYGTKAEASDTREMGRLAQTLNALSAHVTGEETRATGYGRELEARRHSAMLQSALREFAGADAESRPLAGIFDLAPNAGGVADGGRAVLWLGAATDGRLGATCLQARAACLARALLTVQPAATPGGTAEILCASMPTLAACAVWSDTTRILHVRTLVPLHLAESGAVARNLELAPGSTDVPVAVGQRLAWAQPGSPA